MKTEKDWSQLAKNFDERQCYIAGKKTDSAIKEKLASITDLKKILEFGCGIGGYTKVIAKNATHVLATDISQYMIDEAISCLKDFKNIKVQKEDCYSTQLNNNSFDTILMANLIHVIEYPEKALQESFRLLKPNGKLILISYTTDGMSMLNQFQMIYRYLKTFGSPPKNSTPFSLKTLVDFVNSQHFQVQESELLGDHQSKAIFIIAQKKD